MSREKSAEGTLSSTPASGKGPGLPLYAIYTNPDGAISVLQTAGELARGLGFPILPLFARVVSSPLPLECPGAAGDFSGGPPPEAGGGEGVERRVYLCRDSEDAPRQAQAPGVADAGGRVAETRRTGGDSPRGEEAAVDSSGVVKI